MAGRSWNDSTYRYGFNGKEKDDEVKGNGNSCDFGARIYNPIIAQNFSQDPLNYVAYPGLSPYNGFGNNPIANIDIGGKLILWFNGYEHGIEGKSLIELQNYWDTELQARITWQTLDYQSMYFNGSDEAFNPRYSDHNGGPVITSEAYASIRTVPAGYCEYAWFSIGQLRIGKLQHIK